MNTDIHDTSTPNSAIDPAVGIAADAVQVAHSIRVTRQLLDHGVNDLPYDVTERLRAARMRALAQTPLTTPQTPTAPERAGWFSWLGDMSAWLKGGIAVSALVLAGLLSINTWRTEQTTHIATAERATSMNTAQANNTSNDVASAVTSETAYTAAHGLLDSQATHATHATPTQPSLKNRLLAAASLPHKTSPAPTHSGQAPASAAMATALVGSDPLDRTEHTPKVVEAQIDTLLYEQIPLQAYLNDDFERFAAQHHAASNSTQTESITDSTTTDTGTSKN